MNNFQTIITRLKETISSKDQSSKKIRNKDIAAALEIKPTTLASYKSRNKPPYKAILTYYAIITGKILFDQSEPIISYPHQVPIEVDEVRIKYFRNLDVYSCYLCLQ